MRALKSRLMNNATVEAASNPRGGAGVDDLRGEGQELSEPSDGRGSPNGCLGLGTVGEIWAGERENSQKADSSNRRGNNNQCRLSILMLS